MTDKKVDKNLSEIKESITTVSQIDLKKFHQLAPLLIKDNTLLEEFKIDPEKVAKREVDLNLPTGVHMHFIDELNNYYPKEGDIVAQIMKEKGINRPWGRVEIRVGGGGGSEVAWCIGLCNICV